MIDIVLVVVSEYIECFVVLVCEMVVIEICESCCDELLMMVENCDFIVY